MKKTKTILVAVLLILAILSVLLLPAAAAILTPSVYSSTFVGVLDEKVERLASIKGKKVVVVGGSSVAFGLDSALMEEHLGMPVVNFGLYAAIGTKAMLDLSLPHIGEGDIVILAPETDVQTLSLYFSGENMWKAIDDAPSLFFNLRGDSKKEMLGSLYAHAADKLSVLLSDPLDPPGVYNSKSFNAYGDVSYPREQNVMTLYYDPNTPIEPTPSIVSEDFIEYVNEYIALCERKGATVYYSFAPMNAAAMAPSVTEESLLAFADHLEKNILCEHISMIDSYVLDPAYFYDTNYHLNDVGVRLRTKMLIEDIRFAKGDYQAVNIEIPEKPALPDADIRFFETDENSQYFVYETLQIGAKKGSLAIVGLTELGKKQKELTIPLGADHLKITYLGANAFAGGVAETVTIPENSNLRDIATGAFEGSSVRRLYIRYEFENDADELSPPASFGHTEVFVPKNSVYLTHYDWLPYPMNILPD